MGLRRFADAILDSQSLRGGDQDVRKRTVSDGVVGDRDIVVGSGGGEVARAAERVDGNRDGAAVADDIVSELDVV